MYSTKTIIAAGLAGLLLLCTDSLAAEKEVEWRMDYDAARKESTEKNKPLFLEFMTEECVHCRRLEAGPFRDAAVVALLNERFIPLRIDSNRSPKLVQALRIQAYPTMIIAATDVPLEPMMLVASTVIAESMLSLAVKLALSSTSIPAYASAAVAKTT